MTQVVACPSSNHEALTSNPNTAKKQMLKKLIKQKRNDTRKKSGTLGMQEEQQKWCMSG
jgi:hypothetical protein